MLSLDADGAKRVENALATQEIEFLDQLAASQINDRPGIRLFRDDTLDQLLAPRGTLDEIAKRHLGVQARPVRAVLFDKNAESNWAVGWHQDRTIAVRAKCDVPDFRALEQKSRSTSCRAPI